jgi:hypothetical protein
VLLTLLLGLGGGEWWGEAEKQLVVMALTPLKVGRFNEGLREGGIDGGGK